MRTFTLLILALILSQTTLSTHAPNQNISEVSTAPGAETMAQQSLEASQSTDQGTQPVKKTVSISSSPPEEIPAIPDTPEIKAPTAMPLDASTKKEDDTISPLAMSIDPSPEEEQVDDDVDEDKEEDASPELIPESPEFPVRKRRDSKLRRESPYKTPKLVTVDSIDDKAKNSSSNTNDQQTKSNDNVDDKKSKDKSSDQPKQAKSGKGAVSERSGKEKGNGKGKGADKKKIKDYIVWVIIAAVGMIAVTGFGICYLRKLNQQE